MFTNYQLMFRSNTLLQKGCIDHTGLTLLAQAYGMLIKPGGRRQLFLNEIETRSYRSVFKQSKLQTLVQIAPLKTDLIILHNY